MEQFSVNKWLNSYNIRRVVTRDGQHVKILTTSRVSADGLIVVALVKSRTRQNDEYVLKYDSNGREIGHDKESINDLFFEPRVGYIITTRSSGDTLECPTIYPSYDAAIKVNEERLHGHGFISKITIEDNYAG